MAQDRVSRVAEACIRVTAKLDVDDALHALVDEARSIADARYGALVALDDAGGVDAIVTSGLTPEERKRMFTLPERERLLADLMHIEEPLRVSDFPSRVRSLGLPEYEMLAKTFLGTPMRHLGRRLGIILLGEKGGGREFTPEDEEVLGMFAAHGAVVINNARIYRDERRARAELEGLIDSSPLGVLVFDGRTGDLLSINEEARRILGGMRGHGRSLDRVLDVLSFRRPDGRELGLDELPLTRALSSGKTVLAEEVVISQANGFSVTTLINSRPIYSEGGEVVSVVSTMQDMTPFEDLERQRAEFLEVVSRSLRTPLTTIKGSTATALGNSDELDHGEMVRFFELIDQQADSMRGLINDVFDVAQIDLGKLAIVPTATSVTDVVRDATRSFKSGGTRNRLHLALPKELPRILADGPRVAQVLGNLFYNAARLSSEGAEIGVTAEASDGHVAISVESEGQGIAEEQLPNVFKKFYRLHDASDEARIGRAGLGLAICKGIVEAHGGHIWAESEGPKGGARFTFTIPVATVEETEDSAAALPRRFAANLGLGPAGQATILAIEDDSRTLRFLGDVLSDAGFSALVTVDFDEARRMVKVEAPDLVLVGGTLVRAKDFAPMRSLSRLADAPIIFLSERARDQDIAMAFAMGASDYIVKPFSPNELIARIRVALRRRTASLQARPLDPYLLGELAIDYAQRGVTVAGRPVELTATEYELLFQLSTNAGRVLTHNYLLERVWGQGYSGDSQLLRTYVKYLRQKLEDDAGNPKYIFTEPRVGYRMARPQD